MLFWHIGGSIFLFRVIFRDPQVDLRFLAAGALLPNVIDALVGVLIHEGSYRFERGLGHTLLAAVTVAVLGMWVTRPRTPGRRRAVGVTVGILFHLLLDGIWTVPGLLLWPLAGTNLHSGSAAEWSGVPGAFLGHPTRLVQEAVGLFYLVWLVHRARRSDPVAWFRLLRTGIINP